MLYGMMRKGSLGKKYAKVMQRNNDIAQSYAKLKYDIRFYATCNCPELSLIFRNCLFDADRNLLKLIRLNKYKRDKGLCYCLT